MEFGLARFLEMFEERFGRTVTTLLMAALAIAVAAWAIQTTVEAVVYIYGLVRSAHLIAALESESATSHAVVFGIQLGLTYLILWVIWRWGLRKLIDRRIAQAKASVEAKMVEIEPAMKRFDEAMAKRNTAQSLIEQADAAFGKLRDAVQILQDTKPPEKP